METMNEYLSLDIYCNQFFPTVVRKSVLKKGSISYSHRLVNEYPFVLRDGSFNLRLLANIESAFAFYFGAPSGAVPMGEFWAVAQDPENAALWGLFGFSEIQDDGNAAIQYALCPYGKREMLSRTELVSTIQHCRLIRQWGRQVLPPRKYAFHSGYPRSHLLLKYLSENADMQLVFGGANDSVCSFWIDQIWRNGSSEAQSVTCFFSYQPMPFEQFVQNRYLLPQLLLFPGDPLSGLQAANWTRPLPIRTNTGMAANTMIVSSIFGANAYGLLLSGHSLEGVYEELKTTKKAWNDSNVLPYNLLQGILRDSGNSRVPRGFLYHIRTARTIEIGQLPFWMGRELDRPGYEIPDNPRVSRMHAYISCENGCYCITDNNSSNKTRVDGRTLSPNTAKPLNDGSMFSLANEEFLFRCERV